MNKLICLATLLLSLVTSLAPAEELHKVSLQLRWDHQYQFAGYYAAKWQGYYKDAGFDVDIRSAIKADGTILNAVKEVAGGNSDFGVGAADILIGIDQGAPLVILASIFQQSAAEFYAREGTAFNSPSDLINLKVARNINDLIDVELQAMLLAEGIDLNKIVPHQHMPGIQHLVDGTVDVVPGYRLSAPYDFKRQGVKVNTLRPINYGIDFYGDSLFTNSRLIEKDQAAVERFRQASTRGWQYALEHPQEIADKIARELPRKAKLSSGDLQGFNEFQIQPVKELTLFPVVAIGNLNPHRWQHMYTDLKKSGLIKGSFDLNKHIFDFDKIEEDKINRRVFIFKISSALLFVMLFLSGFFIVLLKRQVRIKNRSVVESESKTRISEERYRLIMESVAVIPWEFNIPENRWTYVGPQVTNLVGYTPEEWTTLEWWLELIHPEDQIWVPEYCADLTSRGEEHSMEYRLRAKDGSFVWVIDLVTVEMLDGKPRLMRGVMVDITERKQVEEALIKSRQLLKDTEKIGKVGGWEINTDTKKLTWTDEVYTIHEVDLTCELTIEKALGFYTPESRPIIERAVQRVIDYGEPFDLELELITAIGNFRNVHAIGRVDLKQRRVYGFFQDITEQKLAEISLRNERERLNTILNTVGEPIFLKDNDHRIILANPAFFDMFGLDENAVIGKTLAENVPPNERQHFLEVDRRVLDSGITDLREETLTARDFTRTIVTRKTRFCDASGERFLVGSIHDITELNKMGEEKLALERMLQQTQKLESLGVLSGGIAHDFNNILAIIISNCSLAKMDSDSVENCITEIEIASRRAADLCRQMLAYAGKTQFVKSQVNMGELVADMAKMLKASVGKNTAIRLDLAADIPRINGDTSQLRQIVMNLIINATEAIGDAQGEINVSLRKTEICEGESEKDHLGKDISPGWYACLEVTDNGSGMDDETIRRVFEPFFTTKFTGRGLGMSAVLGIISAHKGALQLSSEPGKGTAFKVYLPLEAGSNGGEESLQQVISAPWQGSGTILLVEDEEQIRLVAKIMLKKFGFTVVEAVNGKEAPALYHEHAADIRLVLTDMDMPVMDGYAMLSELKKINPDLPVIISSGFGDTDVTSRIARENIIGVIMKPYSPEQLREVLKRALEGGD